MVSKYGDDTSWHPLLHNETWYDVYKRVKKGRIYAFMYVSDSMIVLEGTSSRITSQEVYFILYHIKFSYHDIVLVESTKLCMNMYEMRCMGR